MDRQVPGSVPVREELHWEELQSLVHCLHVLGSLLVTGCCSKEVGSKVRTQMDGDWETQE